MNTFPGVHVRFLIKTYDNLLVGLFALAQTKAAAFQGETKMRPDALVLPPLLAALILTAFTVLLSGCAAPFQPVIDVPEQDYTLIEDGRFQGKVEQEVLNELEKARLRENNEVTIVILLKEPEALQVLRDLPPGTDIDIVRGVLNNLFEEIDTQQSALVSEDLGANIQILYEALPAVVATITETQQLTRIAQLDAVQRIGPDIGGGGAQYYSAPITGTFPSFTGNVTGKGVTIAVVDSGYDLNSPEFVTTITHEACFIGISRGNNGQGGCRDGLGQDVGLDSARDENKHGTLVTNIITSDGYGNEKKPVGIAPGSEILAIKVLDRYNRFDKFADIVYALDYLIVEKFNHTFQLDLVNISIGSDAMYVGDCDDKTPEIEAAKIAVDILRKMDVLTFSGAGNNNKQHKMTAPACISSVISVGSVDEDNKLASDTNRSSTMDLVAQGVQVRAIGLDSTVSRSDGTSFASPYATACAALWLAMGMTPNAIEIELRDPHVYVSENGRIFHKAKCPPSN